ncbi:MAG: DinB family protein [Chloroflexota bacterium]|nr:DinB family protein [Dehalococcoidia bacterium]MDW8047559.1 DinB family protein [Chloroflexota bacterium]
MTQLEGNLPGFGNPPTVAAQYSRLVERLLDYCEMGLAGLSPEELNDTHGGRTNSIGFDIWHVVRMADNIIHFAFEREQPVWLRGGFDVRWGLPRVNQGTGMPPEEAYALRFPPAEEFAEYVRAVKEAIVPRIAGMSDEELAAPVRIWPWGVVPRMEAIGHGLIGHGNGHLGRVCLARTLMGKSGLPF